MNNLIYYLSQVKNLSLKILCNYNLFELSVTFFKSC